MGVRLEFGKLHRKWDDSDYLIKQNYFSTDANGNIAYTVNYCDGTSGSTWFPGTVPSDGSWFYSGDGNVAANANPSNNTFTAVNSMSDQISGYVDSTGNVVTTLAIRSAQPVTRNSKLPDDTKNHCNLFQHAQYAAIIASMYLWGALMHMSCDALDEATVDICDAYNAWVDALVESEVDKFREMFNTACYS